MRVLVTGGNGFVGRHLAKHLFSCGESVAITYHPETGFVSPIKYKNPLGKQGREPEELPSSVQAFALDITDKNSVEQLISSVVPDAIYHLAALTFVPDAENNLRKVFDVNYFGWLNILDAVKKYAPKCPLLYVSSSEVYGEPKLGNLPLTETAELRPISVYGVTKAAAELSCYKAHLERLSIIRARPFPHLGPGQSDQFAISSFARQIALIKLGKNPPKISVGNLSSKRDFSDVLDIVRGYREALLNGRPGEAYNFCSGTSIEVGEVLKKLIALSQVEVEIEVDPTRVRKVDIQDTYGSYAKAQKDFAWKPTATLEATLSSLLGFWMEVEA